MDSSQGPYEGEYDNSGPEKALDNDLSTSTHTDNNFVVKHWWKVQFDRRVFVDKVRVVNRQTSMHYKNSSKYAFWIW